MSLPNDRKKHFRNLGHKLNPIVTVAGNGLTENVLAEIERALVDHELIKIKVAITDRDIRKEVIQEICKASKAQLIQEIGKIALILRESDKPKIKTSNIR